MSNKKLLTLLFISIFLISCISAMDWDNVRDYDELSQTITVDNAFGFGDTLAEIKLLTPLHMLVEEGKDRLVAKLQINSLSNYKIVLKEMEFFNYKDMKSINKEFVYKQCIEEIAYRNITKLTQDKEAWITTVIGSEPYTYCTWEEFNAKDLTTQNITLGIFTDVEKGEHTEWIPTLFGERITEWADFEAYTKYEWYEEDDNNGGSLDTTDKRGGQTFTIGNTGTNEDMNLEGIQFKGYTQDCGAGDYIQASIHAVDGNSKPTGSPLTSNYSLCTDFVAGNWDASLNFTLPSIKLSSSTQYALVMNISGTMNILINYDATSTYTGGNYTTSSDNGSTWSILNSDIWFQVWGTAAPTDDPPTATLANPIDYFNTSESILTLNYSCVDDSLVDNVTLYVDGTSNTTTTWGSSNTTGIISTELSFTEGTHTWNITCWDNATLQGNGTQRTFTVDSLPPTINITYPLTNIETDYITTNNFDIDLNWTSSDAGLGLDTCWFYNHTSTANETVTCGNNVTMNLEYGTYTHFVYANDSVNNINSDFETITYSYKILENNKTFNETSYDTATETYRTNLTANSSLTGVTLFFNGTEYATTDEGDGIYSKTLTHSNLSIGNQSVYWNFTYAGSNLNSNTYYQDVQGIDFSLCDGGTPYLNFTFKDEGDLSVINATIPTSSFDYWLGDGSITRNYNFINNSNNPSYAFCFNITARNLTVDSRVQYAFTNYPQRVYDPISILFSNTTTNQTLYLLSTDDGLYVTFQIVNTANQVISGVDVEANRTISGETVTVGYGTTGDDGTTTFWLNPDFSHSFSFTKDGYTTYSTTFAPTQAGYTFTLVGGGESVSDDYFRGITYSILPSNASLFNDTTYTFGFNLTSSFWDVADYGFDLRLVNGTSMSGGSTGVEGTPLELAYNVNNQTTIYMDYYWAINDSYTNATIFWVVYNSANTQFSIMTFFTDLNAYLDTGLFGIDNFGRYLIVFLIIFTTIGIMSYKYGITNPVVTATMIFGVVFFFEVVVDVIPNIRGINNLLTYISALVLILLLFRRVQHA